MNGLLSFQLAHDFENTSFVGNNVKPSFWQRASATMLTVCSSFELELGYIITCEFITNCVKQYCETN